MSESEAAFKELVEIIERGELRLLEMQHQDVWDWLNQSPEMSQIKVAKVA